MTPREVLIAARELISVPERWTQNALARFAADGYWPVQPRSKRARCWCAIGAIRHEAPDQSLRAKAERLLANALRGPARRSHESSALSRVSKYQDHRRRKHADVLALFDRAIAAAERS